MKYRKLFTTSALGYSLIVPTLAWAQTSALAPEATDVEVPIGKVPQALEEKLRNLMTGQGLTSDVVVSKALANSDEIVAKQKSIDAASWGIREAQAAFYPQLILSARYTHLSDIDPVIFGSGTVVTTHTETTNERAIPPGEQLYAVNNPGFGFPVFVNQFALNATLNIPLSDYVLRLSKAVAAASSGKRAAEYDAVATRAAVARDARIAYYQWIRAQWTELVAEQSLAQAEGHLADAKASFDYGLSSKADMLRAESQVKSVALFVERSNTGVLLATERLRTLMRDYKTPKFEIGENVSAALQPSNPPPFENAYATALNERPELTALSAAEQAQLEQASLARSANVPRLDGQANLSYASPNPRYIPPDDKFHATWDVGVMLSWSPTAIFGATASARGAEARAAELAAKRSVLREALRLEIRSALQAVKEEEFAIVATEQGLIAAEESYRVRGELYRSGNATLLEVTDAETDLTRARLEAINAHIDYRIALANLKYALGDDPL